jgi:hypothetical protein
MAHLCDNPTMPVRSSKGDFAQNALRVVEQAIGGPLKPVRKIVQFPPHKKNPAAIWPKQPGHGDMENAPRFPHPHTPDGGDGQMSNKALH